MIATISRGRSKTFRLNRFCRRKLALELACDILLHVGYTPSKAMPMDESSRILKVHDLLAAAIDHLGSTQKTESACEDSVPSAPVSSGEMCNEKSI